MKIYTKTGDAGLTSLFGGERVSKAHFRIDAYGTVDELNAYIGLLRDQPVNQIHHQILIDIQNKLFTIGAILATEPGNTKVKVPALTEQDISILELAIDEMDGGREGRGGIEEGSLRNGKIYSISCLQFEGYLF